MTTSVTGFFCEVDFAMASDVYIIGFECPLHATGKWMGGPGSIAQSEFRRVPPGAAKQHFPLRLAGHAASWTWRSWAGMYSVYSILMKFLPLR